MKMELKLKLRLRDVREDHDKTQKEIAAVLGCTQQVYSRYERGQVMVPAEFLKQLALYYNISADYLLGITNDPEIHRRK